MQLYWGPPTTNTCTAYQPPNQGSSHGRMRPEILFMDWLICQPIWSFSLKIFGPHYSWTPTINRKAFKFQDLMFQYKECYAIEAYIGNHSLQKSRQKQSVLMFTKQILC